MKLAVCLCFGQALSFAQAVTVTGTVTNAITHQPIPGVTIRVFGSNDAQETSTDASGVFRVLGIENCCRVLFDKEGFEAVGPSNFLFQAAANPKPLNLTMLPWPALRGRVLDPNRQPIQGSTVEAINRFGRRKTAKTGSDGGFSFEHNVSPGAYVLLATPPIVKAKDSAELSPTYFPDATERENAGTLTLKAGEDLSGYDIVMRQVPVFNLSGIVMDERGEPAAGAVLQVSTAATKVTADASGRFDWPRVRPGNAVVQADWRRGETPLRGFVDIAVHDRSLEDLKIRVVPPVVVSGTVELDGKPMQVDGSAFLEPINGHGSLARASFRPSGIVFDGVYPGLYHLRTSVSTGFAHSFYLDSVRLGERDITMDDFEIGFAPLNFRVLLKTGGGRVSGSVQDGVGGIVVLVPKGELQRVAEYMATSFFRGSLFQVENVRPGDYYAFAVKGVFNQGEMSDPEYASRVLSGAPTVRVENNGTATVTLVYVSDPSVQ